MIARLIAVIVVHAGVQSALVLGNPVASSDWGFAVLALASFAALAAALWAITWIVTTWSGLRLLASVVTLAVAIAAVAVVIPLLAPFVLVIGVCLVTAAARGVKPLDGLRRRPGRSVLAAAITLVTVLVAGVASIAFGFLVTGVPSAALTWLIFGTAFAALIWLWARVWESETQM